MRDVGLIGDGLAMLSTLPSWALSTLSSWALSWL